MNKPNLPNATVEKRFDMEVRPDYIPEAAWRALKSGKGAIEYGTPGEFCVNAIFTINKYEHNYGAHGYACTGTKDWLSLFKLTGGCNHLEAFKASGVEKSEDYDSLPSWRLLDLPSDYQEAMSMINSLYLGKTIRVVARSPKATQYNTCYYLFAVEV